MYMFKATAIFKNGQYVFNDPSNEIDLNSAKIDGFSPRPVWLLRTVVPGTNQVQYLPTFAPSSEELADANTIQGLWVEQDGEGVMIDCISIDNFNTIANAGGSLQRRYGAAPAFTTPTPSYWCITRADNGTGAAHDKVVTDYVGRYIGNVRLKTNISGVSVYEVQAFGTLKALGTDSVALC